MMILGHSSLLISDYILTQAAKNNKSLTPFQLIKLIFIAHGAHLAATGNPLISDRVEAWKHGPVIPVLYHELKVYGDQPVSRLRYCGTQASSDARDAFFRDVLSDDKREIIGDVLEEYGDWSVSEIYEMCHEKDSPWGQCYTGEYGTEIPDSIIQRYYETELREPYPAQ